MNSPMLAPYFSARINLRSTIFAPGGFSQIGMREYVPNFSMCPPISLSIAARCCPWRGPLSASEFLSTTVAMADSA